jgi:hypothetical protein
MQDEMDQDTSRDVTFEFERLDVPRGPGRVMIVTGSRDNVPLIYRKLTARHPVRCDDDPSRLAEADALRARLRAARSRALHP